MLLVCLLYIDTMILLLLHKKLPFQLQDGAKPWRRILDEKLKLWPAAWLEKNDGWRNLETMGILRKSKGYNCYLTAIYDF